MTGWLVVNHFITSKKFLEIFSMLTEAAEKQHVNLIKKTNVELMSGLFDYDNINNFEKPSFILFWDKDIRLANFLEEKGFKLFNLASAIEICDDKSLSHIKLSQRGIKTPKTIIGPKIYRDNINYENEEYIDMIIRNLGFPLIIKECFGSFGQQVYMIENKDKLIEMLKTLGTKPILFQEFIESSRGRDVRIHIVGGKMVTSMYRYNENDFRANITNGGKMKEYTPNDAQIELAVKVCDTLGLDFAGVDILFGENEEPVFCEVNSNAHFKNIYDCTGVNVAEYIIRHIVEKVNVFSLNLDMKLYAN